VSEWVAQPVNWFYLAFGVTALVCGLRVVTSQNVVHAALYLVATLGATAAMFLLLSAEFVALVLVLVYIGAVIVLFLFGIMITRAPTGVEVALDHARKGPAALLSLLLFATLAYSSLQAFGSDPIVEVGTPVDTGLLVDGFLGRFLIPFEVVGFILLAALVGGITIARRDLTPEEEEERGAV
jgi:NADH-quinone oxidoreductase subunit J